MKQYLFSRISTAGQRMAAETGQVPTNHRQTRSRKQTGNTRGQGQKAGGFTGTETRGGGRWQIGSITGSVAPDPVPEGRIRLYSMRFCPFAQRARLVLNAKGIKYDTININLRDKPDWFLEKNPLGLVPTLETPAGEVVYESPITCEYLDEVYPEKRLLPSNPFGKAQQKMMLEQYSKITPYFYKIPTGRKNGEDVSGLEAELKEKFTKLNEDLVNKKTKFFGGDSITMIDYMMWPWFERLEIFELKHCLDHTPELKKWSERMLEDPAVKITMHSMDTYKAFYKTYVDGKPNFDYGL